MHIIDNFKFSTNHVKKKKKKQGELNFNILFEPKYLKYYFNIYNRYKPYL